MHRIINPSTTIEPEVVKKWIHMPGLTSLDFDHNTSRVVASSTRNMICVFNQNPRKRTLFLAGHEDMVHDVRFNADGTLIASGGKDTFAKVFQSPTEFTDGTPISTKYDFHSGAVRSVDFNFDSSTLLTACNDKIVRLISIETNQAVLNLSRHSAGVRSARFSQSSGFLVSGGNDGYVYVWDARLKRPINKYSMKGPVVSVAADNQNHLIAAASSKASCVFEMRTNRRIQNCLAGIEKPMVSVHFHHVKPLVLMGCKNGTILVSNMFAGNPLFEMSSLIGEMSATKFSRCGQYFAVCGRDPMAQVSLWLVKKRKKISYIQEPVVPKPSKLIPPSSIPKINQSLRRLQPTDRVRSRSDDTLENKHKSFAQLKNKLRKQSIRRRRMESLILLRGHRILDAADRKGNLQHEAYIDLLLKSPFANDLTGSMCRLHSSLEDLRDSVPGIIEEERESQIALEEMNDVCNLKESKAGGLTSSDKKDIDDSSPSAATVDAAESASCSDDRYELGKETLPQMSDVDNSVNKVNMTDEKTPTTEQDLENVNGANVVLQTKYDSFEHDAVRGIPGLMAPYEIILDPRERDQRIQQVLQVALENAKNEGYAAALLREQVTEMLKVTVSGFEAFRGQAQGVICMHDYIMLQLKDEIADDRVPLEALEGFRDALIKMSEYLQSANKEMKDLVFELGHQYMKFKSDKREMM